MYLLEKPEMMEESLELCIWIMYLLKEFLPISYKKNIHLDNFLMLLSLVPDAPRLS